MYLISKETEKILRYEAFLLLLKNVLIDKNVEYLAQDKYRELLKDYNSTFVVGKDIKQRSFDENCASYCKDKNCDFLTADNTAYIHFFKVKSTRRIQLSEFYYEVKSDRYVYLVEMID